MTDMLAVALLIAASPIMIMAALLMGYGIFLSWVLLFAALGNQWCRNLWRNL